MNAPVVEFHMFAVLKELPTVNMKSTSRTTWVLDKKTEKLWLQMCFPALGTTIDLARWSLSKRSNLFQIWSRHNESSLFLDVTTSVHGLHTVSLNVSFSLKIAVPIAYVLHHNLIHSTEFTMIPEEVSSKCLCSLAARSEARQFVVYDHARMSECLNFEDVRY